MYDLFNACIYRCIHFHRRFHRRSGDKNEIHEESNKN